MSWLYLLLAIAALAIAFKAASGAVMVIALLAALGLLLAWLMSLLAQRIERRSNDLAMVIDPAELQRLREQAEARQAAEAASIAASAAGDTAV